MSQPTKRPGPRTAIEDTKRPALGKATQVRFLSHQQGHRRCCDCIAAAQAPVGNKPGEKNMSMCIIVSHNNFILIEADYDVQRLMNTCP